MRIIIILASFFMACGDDETSSSPSPPTACDPLDATCVQEFSPPGGSMGAPKLPTPKPGGCGGGSSSGGCGAVGAAVSGVWGFCKLIIYGVVGFLVWNGLRVIPNVGPLYHVQRALQLFLVPLILFGMGAVLGSEGYFFGLASFLFTPWFRRQRQRDRAGQPPVVEATEDWPLLPNWLRYLLGATCILLALMWLF